MERVHSFTPEEPTYECHDCMHRVQAPDRPGSCPDCGGDLRNIAVPRE